MWSAWSDAITRHPVQQYAIHTLLLLLMWFVFFRAAVVCAAYCLLLPLRVLHLHQHMEMFCSTIQRTY